MGIKKCVKRERQTKGLLEFVGQEDVSESDSRECL